MTPLPFTYRFIPVRARDLDSVEGELLVVPVFEDERPPGGLAGLVDWRMDGLLSRMRIAADNGGTENPHYQELILAPFAAGEDDKLLFPAGSKLSFLKVVIMGLGSRKKYDGARYRAVVKRIAQSVVSLGVKSVTLQLPGWQAAGLPARRACDVFVSELLGLSKAGEAIPEHVCFVEALEFQAEMDERIVELFAPSPRRKA